MVSDSALVALIGESINAEDRTRKMAALVLLDVLRRNGEVLGDFGNLGRTVIPPEEVLAVADEMKVLIAKYHLDGSDHPSGRTSADSRDGIA